MFRNMARFFVGLIASLALIASAQAITINGVTPGPILGITNGSNACVGCVGEVIESTVLAGSAVSLTNNVAANVTTISLTPGDWEVTGYVALTLNAATVTSQIISWVSATSATVPTFPNSGGMYYANYSASTAQWSGANVGPMRFNVTTTTTVYLSEYVSFITNTAAAYGYIKAIRIR